MDLSQSKVETTNVDLIEHHHSDPHTHVDHLHHSQLNAAHLFQEDKDGNVIGRLLIPRPTIDPKDPLVRLTAS